MYMHEALSLSFYLSAPHQAYASLMMKTLELYAWDSGGDDGLTISNALGNFSKTFIIDGGAGTNTLTSANGANTWNITANNAGVRVFRARQALRKRVVSWCGSCAERGCIDCTCGEGGSKGCAHRG